MVGSGAAMEEDVAAAMDKATKASFHDHHHEHQHQGGGLQDNDDSGALEGHMVDFVGFLEFIHSLDIEVGQYSSNNVRPRKGQWRPD